MTAKMVFATPTTVINTGNVIANGAIAGGTTILDNSSNLYPFATATLQVLGTFAAAPTDNSTIDLYMRRHANVNSTVNDSAQPASTDLESAEYVGSFLIYNDDEEQRKTITISLAGVRQAHFFIINNTGQAITGTGSPGGATTVDIEPFSYEDA